MPETSGFQLILLLNLITSSFKLDDEPRNEYLILLFYFILFGKQKISFSFFLLATKQRIRQPLEQISYLADFKYANSCER